MTTATKKTSLVDFTVENLGIHSPSYFPGYGAAYTTYTHCTYGIGDTEEEALDNCLDSMAQSCGFDFTDEIEKRIRADYGACETTTVADALGWSEEETEEVSDSGEGCYFHVGIKWTEKESN